SLPSATVTARSATGVVSLSVAVLLAELVSVVPAGGATVTVLVIVPVADALIWPLALKVTEPPGSIVAVALMSPKLLAGDAEIAPEFSTTNQETLVKSAGNESVTSASTVLGPLLVTVIV